MDELAIKLALADVVKILKRNSIDLDEQFKIGHQVFENYCNAQYNFTLDPYDIYRISKELNIKVVDFINKYCGAKIGAESGLPIVFLRQKKEDGGCVLLKNGICMVENSKPSQCVLYPIKMYMDTRNKTVDDVNNSEESQGELTAYTVRQWLEMNKMDSYQEFKRHWTELLQKASALRLEMLEYVGFERTIQAENQMIMHLMYGAYDIDKDFLTQFAQNSEKLIEYLSGMLTLCRNVCIKKDEY